MSATNAEASTQQEANAPEIKSGETTEQVATEVKVEKSEDAAQATETKPDAASGEDSKEVANGEATAASATNGDKPAEDAKKADDKIIRPRLNGAARNRYRFLVKHGYDREKAAELAKDPDSIRQLREKGQLNSNGKRPNSNGSTGGPANKQARTFTGPVRMVVATVNHPASTLTKEQANTIKSAILKQVVLQKDSALKPHFEDCNFLEGYLLLQCSDGPTVEWLEGVVPKLELWKGASVRVATEKSLLRSDIYVGVFGDSIQDNNKDILSFVESQNDGIQTSKWNIIGRKENKPKKEVELILTMDNASGKLLAAKNLELNYKFAKVTFLKKKRIVAPPGSNVGSPGNGNARRGNRPPAAKNPRAFNTASSFVPIWDNNLPNFGNNSRFNNGGGRDFNRGGNSNRNGGQYDSGSRNRSNNGISYGGGSGPRGYQRDNRPRSLLDQLMHTVNSVNSNGPRRGNGNNSNAGRPNNNRNNRFASRKGFF